MTQKLIGVAVSLAILGVIYWQIELDALYDALGRTRLDWLLIALAMVIPTTMLTALRLDLLMPPGRRLGIDESNRLVLVASVLNMMLPSKLGDVAKAHAMTQRGHLDGTAALALVVFEKGWDVLALLVWCLFGLLTATLAPEIRWPAIVLVGTGIAAALSMLSMPAFAGRMIGFASRLAPEGLAIRLETFVASWQETLARFWADRCRASGLVLLSIFIWFLHLVQIWLFIMALKVSAPFLAILALASLSIFVGLLPFTLAGIGTRDAALIFFFQPYFAPATAAALGLLCTLRYVIPALGGLPFAGSYLASIRWHRAAK